MLEQTSVNPGICPECKTELTERTWRRHLKKVHGWTYHLDLHPSALFKPTPAPLDNGGSGE